MCVCKCVHVCKCKCECVCVCVCSLHLCHTYVKLVLQIDLTGERAAEGD